MLNEPNGSSIKAAPRFLALTQFRGHRHRPPGPLGCQLLSTKLWELQPEAALEVGGPLKLLNRVYTPREEHNNP